VFDPHAIALVHAAATWLLVGLIWVVQLVVYPAFASVGADTWHRYHRAHMARITRIVAPAMLAEAATAAALLALAPGLLSGLGALLLAVCWGSTAIVQVPLHTRLGRQREPDPALVGSLVASNWVRTLAWSARGVVALLLIGSC